MQDFPDDDSIAKAIESINSYIADFSLDKKQKTNAIFIELNSLRLKSGSVEQFGELLEILLENMLSYDKYTHQEIKIYKKQISNKLIKALKGRIEVTTDISELKKLQQLIRRTLAKTDYMTSETLNGQINTKISQIKKIQSTLRQNDDISPSIANILNIITSAEIDKELLKNATNEEISTATPDRSTFTLTEKQKNTQVYFKVIRALENHATQYTIKNPTQTIEVLEELFEMGFITNLRGVIHNYIERQDFEPAKALCDDYSKQFKSTTLEAAEIKRAKTEIHKAEIGAIILKALKCESSEAELSNFFDILDRQLKAHRYSPQSIPLGRTKDGTKKLTLADLYDKTPYLEH